MRRGLKTSGPYETKTMKKRNKLLIIIAGALVVAGIALYGSIGLYAKLNKVDELHTRLDEAAGKPEAEPVQEPAQEQKQNHEPDQEQVSMNEPSAEPQQAPAATLTPGQSFNNVDEGQKPVEVTMLAEEKAQKKREIDVSVTAKLQQLKFSCQARSNSLAGQIAQELGRDDEATAADIQSKYLDKVFSAEADCDAKYNQLISYARSQYKAAGLSDQSLPDWSSQYESAKAEARAGALAVIANSLN